MEGGGGGVLPLVMSSSIPNVMVSMMFVFSVKATIYFDKIAKIS